MRISDLVPPIITRRLAQLRMTGRIYPSYADALAVSGGGYDLDIVAAEVCGKTRAYQQSLAVPRYLPADFSSYRMISAVLLASPSARLNVIDFGGACGAHFFFAKALLAALRKKVALRWHVVETPAMVRAGAALADDQLCFFDELPAAVKNLGQVDLVFASGSIQYHPNPYELVKSLSEIRAQNVFVTRTALSDLPMDVVATQRTYLQGHGPGRSSSRPDRRQLLIPVTFARRTEIERILSDKHDLRIALVEDANAYSAGPHHFNMYGYWASLRESEARDSETARPTVA